MNTTAQVTVTVAFMTAMTAATGGCVHGSAADFPAVAAPAATPETTAATVDGAARTVVPTAAAATELPTADREAETDLDELPLFKRPRTWRELLDFVAASADSNEASKPH